MAGKGLRPLWLAVGLDPVAESFVLLGMAETEAEAREQQKRADENVTFRHSFLMTSDTFAADLHRWLLHHKVPGREAASIIRQFADHIAGMVRK
jgi:hypothetical protein